LVTALEEQELEHQLGTDVADVLGRLCHPTS
jgi:hypothetical protein